jgi:hypothetical protein
VRWIDNKLGLVENVVLFAILAAVLTAARTRSSRSSPAVLEFSFDVVRGGTFWSR